MKCWSCSRETPDGSRFCMHCGAAQFDTPQVRPRPGAHPKTLATFDPRLFTYTAWPAIGALFFMDAGAFGFAPTGITPTALLALALIVFALLYSLYGLFRTWQAVQPATDGLSPEFAALGMALPLFNVFWAFRAVYGLAGETARVADTQDAHVLTVSPVMSLIFCTSFAAATLILPFTPPPAVAVVVELPLAVSYTVLVYQWARFIDTLTGRRR